MHRIHSMTRLHLALLQEQVFDQCETGFCYLAPSQVHLNPAPSLAWEDMGSFTWEREWGVLTGIGET